MTWFSLQGKVATGLLCVLLACAACDPRQESPTPAVSTRGYLGKAELLNGQAPAAPVSASAFAPGETAITSNQLEGRLSLDTGSADINLIKLFDLFESTEDEELRIGTLPPIGLEVIQDGQNLIPVQRGRQDSAHPYWEWVVEPGKAWDEPGDEGWTRASLPFALLQRNANCTHNGMMSFLFRSDGSISPLSFQIASETCYYLKFDMWGTVPLNYQPGEVGSREELKAAYRAEAAARLPVKPLSDLAEDYPGARPEHFLNHDISTVSTYGFLIDGTHYSGGCPSRYGPLPYCEVLDLPSYSLAKTIIGGTVLMQLEQLYPGARSLLVSDYVPECAGDDRWDGVTLEHLLDMSTGNYLSTVDQEDEFLAYQGPMFSEEEHAAKIAQACSQFPRNSEPGTTWVYHTTDTYIAGAVMNAFLKEQTGADNDFYDDLFAARVLAPLNFSPTMQATLRSYDDTAQPFTGYGLTLLADDVVRYADFLMNSRGEISGEQILNPQLLSAALQQDPSDPGMTVEQGTMRYNNGLWAANLLPVETCPDETWIPLMSGYGGISVALLPNNTVYYVFTDGAQFKWAQAALESNRLKPFCENPAHDL